MMISKPNEESASPEDENREGLAITRRTVFCKQCGSSCFEDFVNSAGQLTLICCECGVPLVVLEGAAEEVFF